MDTSTAKRPKSPYAACPMSPNSATSVPLCLSVFTMSTNKSMHHVAEIPQMALTSTAESNPAFFTAAGRNRMPGPTMALNN
eukprot:CAMPEP_0171107864 /NCGR_PEP_ID=MMETSP0766_2-20121228/67732_1 /TAXON_ID=439317 /ORGANISM="Gambierdiscus australes, Strain CAWD 149" /LENGTH=80 /DNA_ID=CAMNT_0011569273 /DNA_START=18 /DNA_END=257 /DNA_ORIENTATION=+